MHSKMDRFVTALAVVIAIASAFVWGWCEGGKRAGVAVSKTETTAHDTVWTEIHDTCWKETAVTFLRTDTVRLAYVPDSAISGTHQDANGYENGKTGTYTDTLIIHDSVYVEIPIERKTFTGEDYRITAHGYAVGLDEVWINRPTVYVTKTQTKTKRWAFSVGAQMGYGYTMHGASPYVGIGAGFGYTF